MDLGLKDKTALVVAASKGLGRAVAEELAAEGANLMICARNREVLEAARDEIAKKTCADVRATTADVSQSEGITAVSSAALSAFGRVDIVVTNAGGPPAGVFEMHDWAAWQRAVDLLPGMRQRRWGRVIHITSIAAKQPVDNLILSNSIRAAVTGFSRTLANEVAADGVTVNTLVPGYTRTERVEELAVANATKESTTPAAIMVRFEREIPVHRLAEPREFAALAAFIASERASYITGQSIVVDGGWIRSLM